MYELNFTRASGPHYPFIRDDHQTRTFQSKRDGSPVDITGATFALEIYDRTGGTLLLTITPTIISAASGTWRVDWTPTHGATLLAASSLTSRICRYRIQRTLGGVTTTLLAGALEVLPRPPEP